MSSFGQINSDSSISYCYYNIQGFEQTRLERFVNSTCRTLFEEAISKLQTASEPFQVGRCFYMGRDIEDNFPGAYRFINLVADVFEKNFIKFRLDSGSSTICGYSCDVNDTHASLSISVNPPESTEPSPAFWSIVNESDEEEQCNYVTSLYNNKELRMVNALYRRKCGQTLANTKDGYTKLYMSNNRLLGAVTFSIDPVTKAIAIKLSATEDEAPAEILSALIDSALEHGKGQGATSCRTTTFRLPLEVLAQNRFQLEGLREIPPLSENDYKKAKALMHSSFPKDYVKLIQMHLLKFSEAKDRIAQSPETADRIRSQVYYGIKRLKVLLDCTQNFRNELVFLASRFESLIACDPAFHEIMAGGSSELTYRDEIWSLYQLLIEKNTYEPSPQRQLKTETLAGALKMLYPHLNLNFQMDTEDEIISELESRGISLDSFSKKI